jgi:hypothetical protein
VVSTTIATAPSGLVINVDGSSYTSPKTFDWTASSLHSISTSSPQAGAGVKYVFSSWSDGGGISHTITVGSGAATYTATFDAFYLLTTSCSPVNGGTISLAPSSVDGYYGSAASVQLTANPATSFVFASWSGSASGTSNPINVSMTAPKSVTANFTPATGVGDAADLQPASFKLFEPYPNPFNAVTGVRFQVPDVSDVTVRMSDALGRDVKVLVHERMAAGIYTVRWDAASSPSGAYFCRMEAIPVAGGGRFMDVKKIVLLK